jgi:hypothetical protein
MEVTYTLTPSDYWSLNWDIILRQPRLFLRTIATLLFVPIICTLLMVELQLDTSTLLIGASSATVLWVAYALLISRRLVARRAKTSSLALRQTTAALGPKGVRLVMSGAEVEIDWRGIFAVVGKPRHIYFYLTAQHAWIVPKRAFASASEADTFLQTAISSYQAAKSHQPEENPPGPIAGAPLVVFDLTLEDLVHYAKMFIGRETQTSTTRFYIGGSGFIAVGLFLLGFSYMSLPAGSSRWAGMAAGAVMIAWGARTILSRSPWQTRMRVQQLAATSSVLVGWRTSAIDPSGYSQTSSFTRQKIAWSGLHDVTEEGDYIYIFDSPVRAFPIPKRAFASPYDAQAFFHAARGYLQQAKSGALADKPQEGSWPPAPTARP